MTISTVSETLELIFSFCQVAEPRPIFIVVNSFCLQELRQFCFLVMNSQYARIRSTENEDVIRRIICIGHQRSALLGLL